MKNFGAWMPCAILVLYLGKEFIDWMWWYHWENDEDEPNPAPLLCRSWPAWLKLSSLHTRVWQRLVFPLRCWAGETLPRLFPPKELPPEPVDEDGRTPVEWLLISACGIWNLEWYDGEYDKQIKQKWDESLAERHAAGTDSGALDQEPENPD